MPSTIVDSITSVIPTLDEDRLGALVERLLLGVGVESVDDLQYVTLEDMQDILTPLQCRRLLEAFKKKGLFHFFTWKI